MEIAGGLRNAELERRGRAIHRDFDPELLALAATDTLAHVHWSSSLVVVVGIVANFVNSLVLEVLQPKFLHGVGKRPRADLGTE